MSYVSFVLLLNVYHIVSGIVKNYVQAIFYLACLVLIYVVYLYVYAYSLDFDVFKPYL
jgi:hypothetical protein